MDKQLTTLLQQTGFTEKESQVYLALLELGEANVTQVAEKAELKRSIIYVILEGLIKRGYASSVPGTTIQRYSAVDPTKILANLQQGSKNFKEMLPILRGLFNKPQFKPKINYFDTKEAIVSVYREINQSKEACFFTSIARLNKFIPEEVESWVSQAEKKIIDLKGRHLLENTPADRKWAKRIKKFNQKVKFLDKEEEIKMDLSLFNNKVALTSLSEHFFIVVIESEALYKSMRLLFEMAWSRAKPLK